MANKTYVAIIQAAENYMKTKGKVSQDNAIKSRDLVDEVKALIDSGALDVDVTRGTILSYISHAANNDDDSAIASGGSWGGYWYDPSLPAALSTKPIDETHIESDQGKSVSFSEKDLYPLLHLWLKTKEFVAKDISNLKSGGKWGNPDVVGVKRVDLFGSVEIEIASCEVKLSEAGWEQFIFEAISHKRFSNRSWFAYRISQPGKSLPKSMEYYAERYKVGIIQILLTNDELVKLTTKDEAVIEELVDRINERVPALYEHVPLQEKADLFDRAKISPTFAFE